MKLLERITNKLIELPFDKEVSFSQMDAEEKKLVMYAIVNQRQLFFTLETNGSTSSPDTITKFRKIRLSNYKKP